jgi:hypothetical protein
MEDQLRKDIPEIVKAWVLRHGTRPTTRRSQRITP